ncbi:MAG: hypothetical protein L0241_28025, partial [Planctomycetia bacterium]|nr:hypothetical protein [Planctomycetia bacterium]
MSVSLRSLSDSDILSSIQDLAARERKINCRLLLHLNEIERRKLHLKKGYSSMFDYCTSGLGYSEPAAARRLRTARCVARFPEIWGLLESNQVNLSTISRVSRVLTPGNREVLLARICGKSQREVDAIVAEYQPLGKPRDMVRPVVVRVAVKEEPLCLPARTNVPDMRTPTAANTGASANAATAASVAASVDPPTAVSEPASPANACEKNVHFRSDSEFHPTQVVFATERRFQYQFTGSEEFQHKLEKIKSVAWHRLPANPQL